MSIEINEGRGVGKDQDHVHLNLSHLDKKLLKVDFQELLMRQDYLLMLM